MKRFLQIVTLFVLMLGGMFMQRVDAQSVLNPADPIVEYNASNPPTTPANGVIAKWVRTKRLSWNTDSWKAYILNQVPFRLKFPTSYNPTANDGKKYPMLVFFHGKGEVGTKYDNEYSLANGGSTFNTAVNNGTFDGFVLIMQCTTGWETLHYNNVVTLINYMMANNKLDPFRVSVNGLSAGGYASWDFLINYPGYAAAGLPMSGITTGTGSAASINKYKFTPVWYFQGGLDNSPAPYTATQSINAAQAAGANTKMTLYPDLGHGTWGRAWSEADFYPFVKRAYAANPWPLFGRSEFCPGETINITVGVASGYDEYQWKKDDVVINGATSNTIQVTSYGVYAARVRRGTMWSDWSPVPVVVKQKPTTVSDPIAVQGIMSRVLPALDTNSVTLTVPTGYTSYLWQKEGSNTTLGTTNTISVSSPGGYKVKVTEEYGCASDFTAPFTVVDANGPNKPSPATNLSVSTVSKTALRLDWDDNPTPAFNETNYEVYQAAKAEGPYKLIKITGADVSNVTIDGLSSNVKYFYKVRAVNNTGASVASNVAFGTTDADSKAPTAPGNLTVTGVGKNSVGLSWTASTDDIGVVGYEIYINGVKSYPTTAASFTVNGLDQDSSYTFIVKAKDPSGNLSPASNQVVATPIFTGLDYKYYTFASSPSVLPNFATLTPVGAGNVSTVTTSPRTQDNNYGFLWEGFINIPTTGTYYFRTASDDGSKLYLGSRNSTTSPYNHNGIAIVSNDGVHGTTTVTSLGQFLQAGVYPIAITFFQGTGGAAMTASWRTPATGTSYVTIPSSAFTEAPPAVGDAPAEVSDVTATAISYKRIDLSWTDNSADETGFEVYRSKQQETGFNIIGTVGANVTTFADSTVDAATRYFYRVRSINASGTSDATPFANAQANFRFNNNYADSSVNNKGLSPSNNPTFNPAAAEGSHALELNGTNQQVNISTASNDYIRGSYTAKTVALWVRADVTSSGTNRYGIIDLGGSDNGMALYISGNTLYGGIASGSIRRSISAPYSSLGWNHVALVYSTNTLKLYVNGVQVASNNSLGFNSVGTTSNGSTIGYYNSSTAFNTTFNYFNGGLDELSIFGYALSANDLSKLMAKTFFAATAATPATPAAPAVPSALVASGASSSSINVSWQDNSNDEVGFEIFRANTAGADYVKLATVAANQTTYTDAGLFAGAVYYYKVRATGIALNSDFTAADSAKSFNTAPLMTAVQDQVIHKSVVSQLPLSATSSGGYITFTADNLPAFAALQQNASGAATITFTPNGAEGTYNDIIITATDAAGGIAKDTFNLVVNSNYKPQVAAISNRTVAENQTISINLTATDQNAGDIISWSASNLPEGYSITPGANGAATLQIQPGFAASGTYNAVVKVTDGNGGADSTTFVLTVTDADPNVKIYTRIKFANDIGAPWNNLQSEVTNNLKNENGVTTNVGITFNQQWWLPYNAGPTTGNNSGVYPDAVLNDFWYFGYYGGPETASLSVTGLDPQKKYNLTMYAGSLFTWVPDNGTTVYTVGDKSVSLYVQGNTQNTVSINEITPQANGTITLNMAKGANTPIGYLNALVITENYDDGNAPAKPKLLTAQTVPAGVQLNWDDVAYNESGYQIYRTTTSGSNYTLVATTDPGAESYLDNTVSGATTYYYALKAVNAHGQSDFTEEVSATTANRIPTLNGISNQTVYAGQSTVLNITSVDDATDHVTLTASNLPSFVTFADNGDGTATLTIAPAGGTTGTFNGVTVTATDNNGASVSNSFSISVSDLYVTSTYVNFTVSGDIAPSPWNNLAMYIPNAGTGIANLQDENNNNTGISLTLTDAWSGTASTGTRFRNGTEIVPEAATRSSMYATNTATRRITISGLNTAKRYNFVFFNNHGVSESTLTNYTIGAETVSLEGSYNANKTVQINGVTPSANGQVVINVTKDAAAKYALLSAMIIQSYTPGQVNVFSPADLRVKKQTTSSIELQWQDRASNETGYEVWRADDNGDYALIATLGANVTGYVDNNLSSNKPYNYAVRATSLSGNSDYSSAVRGYTYKNLVHVNFNTSASIAAFPWNNLNWVYGDNASWSGFKTASGTLTNLGLDQPVKWDGTVGTGAVTGSNSGVYPDAVIKENFGLFPGVVGRNTLTGLNLSKKYDFTFFSSATDVYGDCSSAFTVNGKTVTLNAAFNNSGTVTMFGVTPDQDGEAQISVQAMQGAAYGLLGALVIGDYDESKLPIPQPPVSGGANRGMYVQSNGTVAPEATLAAVETKEESKELKATTVYPNPFVDQFNVYVSAKNNSEGVQVNVYNAQGMQIHQQRATGLAKGGSVVVVKPSNGVLPSGVYYVSVQYLNSQERKTIKLVKQ